MYEDGKLVLKALFSNAFGESEIKGNLLETSNFYGFGGYADSGALTTRCGGT